MIVASMLASNILGGAVDGKRECDLVLKLHGDFGGELLGKIGGVDAFSEDGHTYCKLDCVKLSDELDQDARFKELTINEIERIEIIGVSNLKLGIKLKGVINA